MAVESDVVRQLIQQLTQERQAYIESANKTHELLQQILDGQRQDSSQQQQALISAALPLPKHGIGSFAIGAALAKVNHHATTANAEVESLPRDKANSAFTGDSDDESLDNDSIYVQTPLRPETYDMDGLRDHLNDYNFTRGGQAVLCGLEDDLEALDRPCIFPTNLAEAELDRSHLSHYSIYDVGFDGAPLDTKPVDDNNPTRALEIWNRIRTTNADPARSPAVGRIIVVREPSPKLYAALHYTLNKHFDVDEMFDLLKNDDPALMHPHRAFDKDDRHRRSFVITMEYFTIIGDMCKPQKWQRSDEEDEKTANHIPISRCSSIVALSLEGDPMTKVKNRDRRIQNKYGDVYDPFAPWRVLSIQAYPDWHATTDTHKSSNHYVNGPEAFLYTVEAEFNDARKRLKEVYDRVGDLVEPPQNFIFNSKVRDDLLFEDDKFTYSKKYFWAYQTLSIVNQDITEMIESYRDTFKDSVWEGTNKIIWPGESSASFRYQHFRKRMAKLRAAMEEEIERLEYIKKLNSKKMQDIEALRENLFSGTCVMESRRSVEQTRITIEQNRSIMLLTLVTIFFLPLTFVTSIFGMTNMSPSESFRHFAWVVLAVCIPTYLLIGSLHTDTGLNFWSHNKNIFFTRLGGWLASFLYLFGGYTPKWSQSYHEQKRARQDELGLQKVHSRSPSITRAAMKMRQTAGDGPPTISRHNSREAHAGTQSIPRPQLTSGDAATILRRATFETPQTLPTTTSSPRSPEIAFSIDPRLRPSRPLPKRAATTSTIILSSSSSLSISPRDTSPSPEFPEKRPFTTTRRETDLEEIRHRTRDQDSSSIHSGPATDEAKPAFFGLGSPLNWLFGNRTKRKPIRGNKDGGDGRGYV